ncbi:MAG: galactose-1-phosphate uridylyltransferase [Actinomycetota bacterium]
MATLRQDPTTKEWIILAPRRAERPAAYGSFSRGPLPERDDRCPFCPGNEHMTPPEITRVGAEDAWDQRVVPNLFPALEPGGSLERQDGAGLFGEMAGVGSHEVIVESPLHGERMDEMSLDRMTRLIRLWRDRYVFLKADPATKGVIVFKNYGERAGTSLVHPHSQIVATPVFPPESLRRYAVATRYYDDTGHCVYDDLLEAELRRGERLVSLVDGFAAVAPFAARVPFETWIMPLRHQTSFGQLEDDLVPAFAGLLRGMLGALRRVGGDPDFNVVVLSAPSHEEWKPFFLWHLRILPRLATAAGFELGSGMYINTVSPEASARLLREAMAGVRSG